MQRARKCFGTAAGSADAMKPETQRELNKHAASNFSNSFPHRIPEEVESILKYAQAWTKREACVSAALPFTFVLTFMTNCLSLDLLKDKPWPAQI